MNRARAEHSADVVPAAGGLLRYRDTGLYVLPSMHWTPEFAWLAQSCALDAFDKIMLELPASYPKAYLIHAAARMEGATGVAFISHSDPVRVPIPEFPGDPSPVERNLYFSSAVPLVPDSIVVMLRKAARVPGGGAKVEFVDLDTPVSDPGKRAAAPSWFHDPQEVAVRGLAGWYERWESRLRDMPCSPADTRREQAMARRLRAGVLQEGCRALFVCGASHWPRIADILNGRAPCGRDAAERWPRRVQRMRLVAIPPSVLFSWHRLDIPFVAAEFERVARERRDGFDRDAAVRRMLCRAYEAAGRAVPVAGFDLLQHYLRRRLLSAGRWSCDLDQHLLDAARAVAGAPYAHVLEEEALALDWDAPGGIPEGRVLPAPAGCFIVLVGDDEAHLVTLGGTDNQPPAERRPFRVPRRRSLSPHEREVLRPSSALCMKPPAEEWLHKIMCDLARRRAHESVPPPRDYRVHPFRGQLGAGIEVRRTLRSRALGQERAYVRRRVRRAREMHRCDECPVVWVFDAGSEICHRVGDYFPDGENGGTLYTSFFWFHERRRIEVVRRNRIAYFVRLYRNVTPSWRKELVNRLLLNRIPAERKCHACPWYERELAREFSGPDLAVACAVRWGITDHVTVVCADPAYRIGAKAARYAAAAGVRLLTLAAASFDPVLLSRYALDHELPTRGMWHRPDEWCERFVEPVPGWEPAMEERMP